MGKEGFKANMSKLSFRARALDATKPIPVFRAEEIPDLPDFAAINRAVPQMPTGMEKEEECVRLGSENGFSHSRRLARILNHASHSLFFPLLFSLSF